MILAIGPSIKVKCFACGHSAEGTIFYFPAKASTPDTLSSLPASAYISWPEDWLDKQTSLKCPRCGKAWFDPDMEAMDKEKAAAGNRTAWDRILETK